jgi:predicted aspartyl protease
MKLVFSVFVFILFTLSPLLAQSILSASPLKVEKQFYFISVKIDGRGSYNFMVDTGAGITVIRPELASDLGLTAPGTAAMGTAGNKVKAITYADVPLAVGHYSLGDCSLAPVFR